VILDEAQNTTIEQMKLFITRIGNYAQFAVNGDVRQSDLRGVAENGLEWVVRKLAGRVQGINVIEFSNTDVVRSEILAKMLPFIESPDERVVRTPRTATSRHSFVPPAILRAS
jgi:phosphate starvation-inducible PhoH-like protein